MGTIKIVADSTCDLSPELLEKYDISVIPLCIVMGDQSYYDGLDTTPQDKHSHGQWRQQLSDEASDRQIEIKQAKQQPQRHHHRAFCQCAGSKALVRRYLPVARWRRRRRSIFLVLRLPL